MPRFQILPTEQRFFDLFEQHANTLVLAAQRLRSLVEDYTDVEGKFAQLTEAEHQGDFITHEIIDLARRSFTTPFDTEDITRIASAVDDSINGCHATANAIATVIATRVLKPWQAILMAGGLNFVGALTGTAVAATVGKGILDPTEVTQPIVMAALVGAICWNLLTWYYGI